MFQIQHHLLLLDHPILSKGEIMKDRKGLTLIEIIITIAIMAIIAVIILGVFNISIKNIFKSGQRTEKVLNLKKDIDKEIRNNEVNKDGNNEITVSIPDIDFEKKIEGTFIDKYSEDLKFKIQTFVPNEK